MYRPPHKTRAVLSCKLELSLNTESRDFHTSAPMLRLDRYEYMLKSYLVEKELDGPVLREYVDENSPMIGLHVRVMVSGDPV